MRRTLALLAMLSLPAFADTPSNAAPGNTVVPPPPTVSASAASADVPPPVSAQNQTSAAPEPEVRIIQKGDNKIEEYRLNGRLYMVKVTPSIGLPYYLMDTDGTGQMRQVNPSQRVIIPRWVLISF